MNLIQNPINNNLQLLDRLISIYGDSFQEEYIKVYNELYDIITSYTPEYRSDIFRNNYNLYLQIINDAKNANINRIHEFVINIITPRRSDSYKYAKLYNGTIYNTQYGDVKILLYLTSEIVIFRFIDTGFISTAQFGALKCNRIRDPFRLNKYGGYFGFGIFTERNKYNIYSRWSNLLIRSNSLNFDSLETKKYIKELWGTKYDSYENCTLCVEWMNYQTFASWYYNQIFMLSPDFDYEIDKDILQWTEINKIYSPTTCLIIPNAINSGINKISDKNNLAGTTILNNRNKFVVQSQITIKGKKIHLGEYDNEYDANQKYIESKSNNIISLANFYYNKNALSLYAYESILYIADLIKQGVY